MSPNRTSGNRIRLLENGDEYFPRVFAAIAAAQTSVLLETFILFDDRVGVALREALIAAAKRGVHVAITVDGYGSPDLPPAFVAGMVAAGVRFHIFAPRRRLLGVRTNLFRRLHRKLVAIDGRIAFIGGINFSAQHLTDHGPQAKQDYAVEVEGPVAHEVHRFLVQTLPPGDVEVPAVPPPAPAGNMAAWLVTRDNDAHPTDIEWEYLQAIRAARHQVVIANAYFLPGYRVLHAICEAAQRGVDVRLILQGNPDMLWVKRMADMLYAHLQDAGVRIFEYCERPLHGKVAVIDRDWSTVGSSNLDPLSLSLNLEANLVIRDAGFARGLRENLDALMANACREIPPNRQTRRAPLQLAATTLMFHFLRRFPAWAGWLPAHTPKLVVATAEPPRRPWRFPVLKRGAGGAE
ncbi:cardiolipin synthase ClsB [Cupriavidus gilardii]|uniref:Cardiolipin synthase B n=1 Tax=Cupriavidus gilardii TaxID=82541 RepID=A0ABY4VHS8_9BURK|nr:cardiolipin synthase ClsB [Cupriavidus gilardii]MCT9116045.1 cardiolipin synthase ClsB [Cupriavidus gilardii]MCT9124128.1 cardiolipin synthase ClsB [Cupriavidus gilardii]USE76640.1 cardiolipin synthase ClsB [Cupriavidus gilardii]UXC38134.1 cardiolipin synthase ClsB [Cupriavidus gilardii]